MTIALLYCSQTQPTRGDTNILNEVCCKISKGFLLQRGYLLEQYEFCIEVLGLDSVQASIQYKV